MNDTQEKHWLVRPETIRLIWWIGGVVLALLVVGDVFVHGHPYFWVDGTFAFNAWYGLVTCIAMVLFAKGIGVFLKRDDTYYDEQANGDP